MPSLRDLWVSVRLQDFNVKESLMQINQLADESVLQFSTMIFEAEALSTRLSELSQSLSLIRLAFTDFPPRFNLDVFRDQIWKIIGLLEGMTVNMPIQFDFAGMQDEINEIESRFAILTFTATLDPTDSITTLESNLITVPTELYAADSIATLESLTLHVPTNLLVNYANVIDQLQVFGMPNNARRVHFWVDLSLSRNRMIQFMAHVRSLIQGQSISVRIRPHAQSVNSLMNRTYTLQNVMMNAQIQQFQMAGGITEPFPISVVPTITNLEQLQQQLTLNIQPKPQETGKTGEKQAPQKQTVINITITGNTFTSESIVESLKEELEQLFNNKRYVGG